MYREQQLVTRYEDSETCYPQEKHSQKSPGMEQNSSWRTSNLSGGATRRPFMAESLVPVTITPWSHGDSANTLDLRKRMARRRQLPRWRKTCRAIVDSGEVTLRVDDLVKLSYKEGNAPSYIHLEPWPWIYFQVKKCWECQSLNWQICNLITEVISQRYMKEHRKWGIVFLSIHQSCIEGQKRTWQILRVLIGFQAMSGNMSMSYNYTFQCPILEYMLLRTNGKIVN